MTTAVDKGGTTYTEGPLFLACHAEVALSSMAVHNPSDHAIVVYLVGADLAKINSGKQLILVRGTIDYSDGFADDPKQARSFCFIKMGDNAFNVCEGDYEKGLTDAGVDVRTAEHVCTRH